GLTRFRLRLSADTPQNLVQGDAQALPDPLHSYDRDIQFTTLYLAKMRAMQAAYVSQFFLADPLALTQHMNLLSHLLVNFFHRTLLFSAYHIKTVYMRQSFQGFRAERQSRQPKAKSFDT